MSVIHCFKAEKWDFVGRDALYMAVTWLPRSAAAQIDFDELLRAWELNEPMRNPPPIPILGYIIGGIGFGLGGSLWRMSKR